VGAGGTIFPWRLPPDRSAAGGKTIAKNGHPCDRRTALSGIFQWISLFDFVDELDNFLYFFHIPPAHAGDGEIVPDTAFGGQPVIVEGFESVDLSVPVTILTKLLHPWGKST
jgi:hypothetical protein